MTLLLLKAGPQTLAAAGPTFSPLGVHFNGSTYIRRTSTVYGATSPLVIINALFNTSALSANFPIFYGINGAFDQFLQLVFLSAGSRLMFNAGAGADTYEAEYSVGAAIDSNWHSITVAVDMNHGAGLKVITAQLDGVSISPSSVTDTNGPVSVDWSTFNQVNVGAAAFGGAKYIGDYAEVLVAPAQYLDMSNSTNIAKFYGAGHPVDLGADGSAPTGSQPPIYLSVRTGGVANDFCTNLGSGGSFSVAAGALSLSATNP